MIYHISYEDGHIQLEKGSEVLRLIHELRQRNKDKRTACINIVTNLYNLDLWMLPIKNLAFLFFESRHKEDDKAKGNLISIDEAILSAEYIIKNNCLAHSEEWHSC